MENKANQMKNQFQSLVEDAAFIGAIQGLQSFVFDNTADLDMAYDWICEMADISSFVADDKAWDLFYDTYETALAWLTQTMTIMNPYVENLVSMGYDRKDVETASTMFKKKTFPYTIHGRTYQTEEEYNEAIHDFMNGM